jgi:ABC-type molybdate transport system substrate-binding protein
MIKQRPLKIVSAIAAALFFFSSLSGANAQTLRTISVLSTAELAEPVRAIVRDFTAQMHIDVDTTFVSGDELLARLKAGAAPDVILAPPRWMPPPSGADGKHGYRVDTYVAASSMCLVTAPSNPIRPAIDIIRDPKTNLAFATTGTAIFDAGEIELEDLERNYPGTRRQIESKIGHEALDSARIVSSADAIMTYCALSSVIARRSVPDAIVSRLPGPIGPRTDFAVALRDKAPFEANLFAYSLWAPEGRMYLREYGFDDQLGTIGNGLSLAAFAPGQGALTIVTSGRITNGTAYRIHYAYRYLDGHIEEADIPWAFRYQIGEHDPFAAGDRCVAIQPPPADFKPSGPLPAQLQAFFGGPAVEHVGRCP